MQAAGGSAADGALDSGPGNWAAAWGAAALAAAWAEAVVQKGAAARAVADPGVGSAAQVEVSRCPRNP